MDDDNTAERWEKTDAPYDYFVSTSGRVKNKKDRIMKQQFNEDGYYCLGLTNKKKKTVFS